VQIKSTHVFQKPADSYLFIRFEFGTDFRIGVFDEEIVMTTNINPGTDILKNYNNLDIYHLLELSIMGVKNSKNAVGCQRWNFDQN